jgi:hypothetical protein
MVRSTPARICCPVSFTDAVSPRTSRSGLPEASAAAAATAGERPRVWKEIEGGGAWRRRRGRDEDEDEDNRGDDDETAARGGAMGGRRGRRRASGPDASFLLFARSLVAARLRMTTVPRMTVDGDGTADRTAPS